MAVKLSPVFVDAQLDSSGNPYVGAQLFTYAAASTTKQTAYQDSLGATPHANPIVLNARGEPPAPIWLTEGSTYKLYLTTPTDTDPPVTSVRVIDNVSGVNDTTSAQDEWVGSGSTPTYISATSFSVAGDKTGTYTVGRRLKTTNSGGTIYSTVSSSSFGASITTVVVVNDSSTLDSGLSAVSLGILRADHSSIPHTKVDSGGITFQNALAIAGVLSPSQITSNQNDYSPTGLSTSVALRLTTDASRNITSIAGGASGRVLKLLNVGSFNIVLKNDDGATGTAANRFALAGDVVLYPDQTATLYYDSTTARWRLWDTTALRQHGRCYLSKSSTNLLLSPKDGNTIVINGRVETIPDAGVTLGVGGLAATTVYFIYAYMSSGTMTLEASATGHSAQAGTGVEIKTGDATRSLVGLARTNGSTAWEDDYTVPGVASYFNRRDKAYNSSGVSTGTSSTSFAEASGTLRSTIVTWADEAVVFTTFAPINNSSGSTASSLGIGIDSTTTSTMTNVWDNSGPAGIGSTYAPGSTTSMSMLSEGGHFLTPIIKVSGGASTLNSHFATIKIKG